MYKRRECERLRLILSSKKKKKNINKNREISCQRIDLIENETNVFINRREDQMLRA